MRHIYLLITIAALLVGCASQHNNDSSTIYDSGVSRELADWRKATIADLRYNLHFEIPAERSSEVVANVEILFRLDTPQEIVIDFRDLQGIKSVCNNVGEIIEYTAENEHIIIPESYTQIGENSINIEFIAGSQSLNRNDEFLYTLLVPDRARTLFPCFDQPNLKASFTLSLECEACFLLNFYQKVLPTLTASKSSSISFEGALVRSDTMTMHTEEKMNAGSSS